MSTEMINFFEKDKNDQFNYFKSNIKLK